MTDTKWTLHGREFANCNCSYGCPCQFNALPTNGNCWAVVGIEIDKGHHGAVPLDGLRLAGIFRDASNTRLTVGGDSGLRGYPSGAFVKGDRRLVAQGEFRTRSVKLN